MTSQRQCGSPRPRALRHGWPLHVIEDAADDPTIDQPEAFLNALRNALGEEGR